MTRIRRDVWKLATAWDEPILWYARGVQALQARRQIDDVTSWRYLAAMHGIDEGLWRELGYLGPNEPLPQPQQFSLDENQCQHHTWYFLPWHRGYLAAFERIVRSAIVELKGPKDWALPYWNYSDPNNPNARTLPTAFASEGWPDGNDNPLYVARRYGIGNGTIIIRPVDVDLKLALRERDFAGKIIGGSPGFGGGQTPFQHDADRKTEGLLEQQPHDVIHGQIGGALNNDDTDRRNLGLMSAPELAALDPVFWLHHANIDRLWEVWLRRAETHHNPSDPLWLDGPLGARIFTMPAPDGSRQPFSARQMLDTTSPVLDYAYEDVSDPLAGQERLSARLRTLGMARTLKGAPVMTKEPRVELFGASTRPVRLVGKSVAADLRIDKPTGQKVLESFNASNLADGKRLEPDRIFLNLENIKGTNDAAVFDVYVGLRPDDDPANHPDNLAGVVSLFGLRGATAVANPHGGNGLNKVIEITDVIDRLHLRSSLSVNDLSVRFIAAHSFGTGNIEIGRISLYRQGD